MDPASAMLKKVDLLAFISQSEAAGPTLRVTSTDDGTYSGVISFPSCGNWINKPVDPAVTRSIAPAFLRVVGAR